MTQHVPKNRNRKSIKGFTLVELLVVISIISLLLSILMPSLNRAREMARRVVCLSNMKTLTYAAAMYSDDNDNWALTVFDQMDMPSVRMSWPLMLYSYAPNAELFYCPGEKQTGPEYFPEVLIPKNTKDQYHHESGQKYDDFFTYGLNFSTFGWCKDHPSYPGSKRSRIESYGTSNTLIHFGDSMPSGVGYEWVTEAGGIYLNRTALTEEDALSRGVSTWAPIGFRHLGTANFAHVDAHVSTISEAILGDPLLKKPYWSPFLWQGELFKWR